MYVHACVRACMCMCERICACARVLANVRTYVHSCMRAERACVRDVFAIYDNNI